MSTKVIKLQDNENNVLLPVTDAKLVQMKVENLTKSVQDVIIENELITASALTDLNDTKQDVIDDLDEIRSGAALGVTALQTETQLSKGTTGSGNAVTDISVNNHQITLTKGATFLTEHQDLSSYADGAEYDSTNHLIYLKHGNTRLSSPINASDFIKDGMVDTVEVTEGNLVITFNTDSGKEAIEIPLSEIFDPSLYYTKEEIDEHELVTARALTELHDTKQDLLTFDNVPTTNSLNPVTSGGIKTALDIKADKTELPLVVHMDGALTCDTSIADIYTAYSTGRVVQMKFDILSIILSLVRSSSSEAGFAVTAEKSSLTISGTNENGSDVWTINSFNAQEELTFDYTPTTDSQKPVTSGGIKTYVDDAIGANAPMTEITYSNLVTARNNNNLKPGTLYRITDYQCTTTQENTRSAGHQFDIVLLALSEDKLAEEGWAMMHDNIYDVTFGDGVTRKCYLHYDELDDTLYVINIDTLLGVISDLNEVSINEENHTATTNLYSTTLSEENLPYNYFQNSKLEAWKVWYCLDNDTSRFAWADDSVDESTPARIEMLRPVGGNRILIRTQENDTTISNIQYYAWMDGQSIYHTLSETPQSGDDIYGYIYPTPSVSGHMDKYGEVVSFTPAHESTGGRGVIYRLIDEFNNDIKYDFKNILFKRTITDGQYDENGTETWCYTLNVWYNNICQDASIVGNTLPNDEGYISGAYDNVFGYATANDLYLDGVNTFTFVLGDNVMLSFDDDGVYFGIYSNTIGNSFHNNTIGNDFALNTIGNDFSSNMIGNNFYSNMIGNYFYSNTIGTGFNANMIGNYFNFNTIGNNFFSNTIGDYFYSNTIGTKNGNTITTIDYVRYIRVEDGIQFVDITTSATTSNSNWLQNITIAQGVRGTSASTRKVITHGTLNDTFRTTYQPANSQTVSV